VLAPASVGLASGERRVHSWITGRSVLSGPVYGGGHQPGESTYAFALSERKGWAAVLCGCRLEESPLHSMYESSIRAPMDPRVSSRECPHWSVQVHQSTEGAILLDDLNKGRGRVCLYVQCLPEDQGGPSTKDGRIKARSYTPSSFRYDLPGPNHWTSPVREGEVHGDTSHRGQADPILCHDPDTPICRRRGSRPSSWRR
jgi:hypothetical protein